MLIWAFLHTTCVHIGGLGELVRLLRPPVTGRSASLRLRFRFVRVVRAMRAGEARCVGAYRSLFLSLGLPGASIRVLRVCLCLFVDLLCTGAEIFALFVSSLLLLLQKAWVLTPGRQKLQDAAWVTT